MDWKLVKDELPVEGVFVLVFGRFHSDDCYGYGVDKFRRSLGWGLSDLMSVEAWVYFDPFEDGDGVVNPCHRRGFFNRWLNPE